VSQSDDSLGLINAFLAAGATTMVGTLWPLDNADAEEFSREFMRAHSVVAPALLKSRRASPQEIILQRI